MIAISLFVLSLVAFGAFCIGLLVGIWIGYGTERNHHKRELAEIRLNSRLLSRGLKQVSRDVELL